MLQNYICIKREVTDEMIGLFVQDDLDDIPERFPCKAGSSHNITGSNFY